jgi:hypothetical protein
VPFSRSSSIRCATLRAFALVALLLPTAIAPAQVPVRPPAGRGYIKPTVTLRDVDLTTLLQRLQRFGLRLPITGSGKVSATVTAEVPWRHLLTQGDYGFRATIWSPRLQIAGLELRDAHASAVYADGKLGLHELRFTWWDAKAKQAAAAFRGSANVQVNPRGNVDAELSIEALKLSTLARQFAGLPAISAGTASGGVSAHVPLNRVRELDAWQATGRVALSQLQVADLPAAEAKTQLGFQSGTLTLSDSTAALSQTRFAGGARVQLGGRYPFEIQIGRLAGELSDWMPLAHRLGTNPQVAGKSLLTGNVQGQLLPLAWNATGTVALTHFAIEDMAVDSLRFDYSSDGQRLDVRRLVARLYRGAATGTATLPLTEAAGGKLDLSWRDIQAGDFLRHVLPQSLAAGGTSRGSFTLRIPSGKLPELSAWQSSGDVAWENGTVRGVAVTLAGGNFALADGSLTLSALRVRLAQSELLGAARVQLRSPFSATLNYSIPNLDLADLAPASPFAIPDLSGQLVATGTAQAELANAKFTTAGSGSLQRARLRGLRLDRAAFGFGLSRHGLNLSSVDAYLYDGRVQGAAIIPFSSRVAGSAKISWDNLQAGRLVADTRLSDESLTALASGRLQATLPAGHNFQLAAASGRTRLVLARFNGFGVRNARVALAAKLDRGELNIDRLEATAVGAAAEGALHVGMSAPFNFAGRMRASGDLRALPLSPWLPAGDKLSGKFQVESDLHGALEPRELFGTASGDVRALQLGKAAVDALDFQVRCDGRTLALERLDGRLYGGSLRGSAVLPLAPDANGKAQLDIQNIDVGRLALDFLHIRPQLNAVVEARIEAQIPQGTLAEPESWDIAAKIAAPAIKLRGTSIGKVAGTLNAAREQLDYDLTGTVLGGRLVLRGQWNAPGAKAVGPNNGLVELTGVRLERIAPAFPQGKQFGGLSGTIEMHLPFELPGKLAWPTGKGEFRLSDIHWRDVTLTERIAGAIHLQRGRIEFVDVAGSLAGGRVRGSAVVDLRQSSRGRFALAVDNVRSQDLLAPWSVFDGLLAGTISANLRGVLTQPWRVAGTVEMNEGQLMSVPVNDIRLPVTVAFAPRSGAFEVNVSDGNGQFAHGRAQIQCTLRSTRTLALDTQVKFADVDVQPLLAKAGGLGQLTGSRATGTMQLSGQDVRSPSDLSGSLEARLRNLQPGTMPLFGQLLPYLSGGLAGGGSFDDGLLRAHIGSGVLQIERFSLASATAQLFASGRVGFSGSLDLSVEVSNNPLPGGVLAPALLARLAIEASNPVGWIILADQFLSNRVIDLDVSGTVANPAIRVRPVPLLTNEAARFFLGGGI